MKSESFLRFVSTREGESLATIKRQAGFSVAVLDRGVEITPVSTGRLANRNPEVSGRIRAHPVDAKA